MRNIVRALMFLAVMAPLVTELPGLSSRTAKLIELHYLSGINGLQLMANVDDFLAGRSQPVASERQDQPAPAASAPARPSLLDSVSSLRSGNVSAEKPAPPVMPSGLNALATSTVMILGASADGIGIGTGFTVRRVSDDVALIATAYHVVDRFCAIPEATVADQVSPDRQVYSCQSLFVLHDIAVNLKTNEVEPDGSEPWKTEVTSLVFFDKKLDLAAFLVQVPATSTVATSSVETAFDPRDAKFKVAGKLSKLDELDVYLIAYPAAFTTAELAQFDSPQLIKKRWFAGRYLKTKTFENDRKLGFISALKHTIHGMPGTSGGPMALADGRVFGLNTSILLNRYYVKSGCATKLVEDSENYAIPSSYLRPIVISQKATEGVSK